MNKPFILTIILLALNALTLFAQEKETYLYAVKDTSKLYLDVYVPTMQNERQACLFFVFGGGFIGGARDDKQIEQIKKYYTDKGFVVIAIDYRLGMRGQKDFSLLGSLKSFQNSIDMAAEDLISSIDYTLKNLLHTEKYTINPKNILVMGSSAGAITALQADYALCNHYLNSNILPDTFRFAGIISYAGAIFSTHGKPKYKNHEPAPTLFCHGDQDKLVIYNKTQFCNIGLFGSNAIAKQFKKNGYGFQIRRYTGLGHQVAMIYNEEFPIIDQFIDKVVFGCPRIQIDETYYNPAIKPMWVNFRVRDLKRFAQ